ncbi:transmembrane emp24 domain-containing protein p24delta7-like [Humulus lupulus]|uniref:transmembrane emp24 domain-containing protein p24delta7-like n=1 Tax=Humulus lupulus TaxID=3486 RepID=UPI002B41775D|nr:transmembrane emp24 domain-containing protein p24delta7-like [Humulus lupulus]
MSAAVLLVVLLLVLTATAVLSMRFDLQSGTTKCISEEINANAMTLGKYLVVNPYHDSPLSDTHKVNVRVSSPNGNNYHYMDNVESGNFGFTAPEKGDYTTCFWAPEKLPPKTITVEFDWRTGVAATDWSNVAKKGQVDTLEVELKKMYTAVTHIHDEMFHLREREDEMQQFNRTTNSKMATFSFLSLLVCLSVAGLQFWHLKTYFQKKKLL